MKTRGNIKMENNLSELFRKCREYGRVDLFTSESGFYSCTISFNTISHVELSAKSGYNTHKTPEAACEAALAKAIEIVSSLEKDINNFKKLTNKED